MARSRGTFCGTIGFNGTSKGHGGTTVDRVSEVVQEMRRTGRKDGMGIGSLGSNNNPA